jgi:hypothetical protein
MLNRLQVWLFSKGAGKKHSFYEKLGNIVQSIRIKLNS